MGIKAVRMSFNKDDLEYLISVSTSRPKLNKRLRVQLLTNEWDATVNDLLDPKPVSSNPADSTNWDSIREQAFIKWNAMPNACNEEELKMVRQYRYDNNMMIAEERAAFEEEMFSFDPTEWSPL